MWIFEEERVDATRLLVAWDQLSFENTRAGDYHAAADFWARFGELLAQRSDAYRQHRNELLSTRWQTDGAMAFLGRVDAGLVSIDTWLDATPANIASMFHAAADTIGPKFQRVSEIRDMLSGGGPVWERFWASGGAEVPVFRMEGNTVVAPPGYGSWVQERINEAEAAANEVADTFNRVKSAMALLPTPQWAGPLRAIAPVDDPTSTAPGTGPGTGGPGGGPTSTAAGPGGPGATPSGGPEPPATEPAAMDASETGPGGPGSETSTTPQSASDAEVGETGLDQPASDQLGGPDPTAIDQSTQLPPVDPELAGAPTATLDPTTTPTTTSLPPSAVPSGLSTTTGSDPGRSPGTVPFTPAAATPFQPTRRDGVEPAPRNSTVEGPRDATPTGSAPGGTNPGGGPTPVPRGGMAGSGPGATTGAGFYPPFVPPMGAGGLGGGANGGVRPGEAEFAGGPIRQAGGRDSWRAGLRPQLLGRAADDRDEDPYDEPPVPSVGGGVLDEELWQVPGAAPATPPDPPQRRGRSW